MAFRSCARIDAFGLYGLMFPARSQHLCNLAVLGMQAVKVASTAAELWQATKTMAPLTLCIDEAHAMVCCG